MNLKPVQVLSQQKMQTFIARRVHGLPVWYCRTSIKGLCDHTDELASGTHGACAGRQDIQYAHGKR